MQRKPRNLFLWRLLKQYLLNSNVHGFKYLVEPDRHWTERLFWMIACGLSCWACGLMVISTIQFATARDVSITMTTDYLEYEAPLPALHFCQEMSDAAKKFMKSKNIDSATMNYPLLGSKSNKIPTEEELAEITRLITPDCEDILLQCLWNDEEINCCELFFPLHSNFGVCLSANSLQSIKPVNATEMELIMNHRKQGARLTIFLKRVNKIPLLYLTNYYEYPTLQISKDRQVYLKKDHLIVVDVNAVPTYNQREVIDMPMSMRKCRMSSENADNLYMKWYNYDGCLMEQQMHKMIELYKCISHVFPRVPTIKMCNLTQLEGSQFWLKAIKNISDSSCLPDCEGIVYDFSVNLYEYTNLPKSTPMQIEVNMLPGPSIQYARYATRSLLQVIIAGMASLRTMTPGPEDLDETSQIPKRSSFPRLSHYLQRPSQIQITSSFSVSVGSVVGLFMGASLLSIVEILYWLLIRTNP